ncbi:MAG TPA: DUF3459 domain-containing protein, partial [Polyangiaceae bacterium]|nr:DUF3459 domain-containing protein [Polyangiaceae bacterium]
PVSIVREITEMASRLEPRKIIIGEDERNDPPLIAALGMDAVWADDFHHQVHATLTGEHDGYYAAYEPGVAGIARALQGGWLYEGAIYPPTGRPRGKVAHGLPAHAFVYCLQNHDQVGNRAFGERLSDDISLDAYCAASALLLLVPMTPLLFMGQEWAATSPFLYFTDHDEETGRLVSAGRREEFKSFSSFSDPAAQSTIPDPQALDTFWRSRLRWHERGGESHQRVLRLYRELLSLRRTDPVFRNGARERMRAEARDGLLWVRRWNDAADARVLIVNLSREDLPLPADALRGLSLVWSSGATLAPRASRIGAEMAMVWTERQAPP